MNRINDDIHYVSPKLPAVLTNVDNVPVFQSSNNICYYGLVFNGSLDVKQLVDALSSVLQLYPYVSGTINIENDRWIIALVNKPIPLTIRTAPPHLDSSNPTTFQTNNSIFTDPLHADLTQRTLLVKLKMTYWPLKNESSLFLSWSCVLGDEEKAYEFMHTLHRLYLCLPPLYHYQIPSDSHGKSRPTNGSSSSPQKTDSTGRNKRERQFVEILLSQVDLPESQPGCLEDAVRAYLMSNTTQLRSGGKPEKLQIRNLQHLLFPDLTFGLDSPSLPPKRSRFFYIKMDDELEGIDEVAIWPANPPFPLGHLRLLVSVESNKSSKGAVPLARL